MGKTLEKVLCYAGFSTSVVGLSLCGYDITKYYLGYPDSPSIYGVIGMGGMTGGAITAGASLFLTKFREFCEEEDANEKRRRMIELNHIGSEGLN
mgnify:CR=1 FL=1